ncbi:MAG: 2-amino-4-hydroxy-6-hydroxymethyldihydropteridine diphosphokinase [Planctomycetaceae bacterium]|nr:2-amino-4-hydroxy-6-hydroxymethyldihydropteridine diphosphokinase [Planctomycetaceae bacterium]
MSTALISLGSNLGDRRLRLDAALSQLATTSGVRLLRRSRCRASVPVGGPPGQDAFLNGAALLETSLGPQALLAILHDIEQRAERRRAERWASRTLDLDLLLHGETIVEDDQLTLPHPRMTSRRFVLNPAREIAGALLHPTSGWTVAALARQLDVGRRVVVAADDDAQQSKLIAALAERCSHSMRPVGPPAVEPWQPPSPARWWPAETLLMLAVCPSRCTSERNARQQLKLPAFGPVTWLGACEGMTLIDEAAAAVQAASSPA